MKVLFNNLPLKSSAQFEQPDVSAFKTKTYKGATLKCALENSNDYIREVINSIELNGNRKNVLVDIKIHDIEKGKYPCIPGWHCDTVVNPLEESEDEIHHIFVTGYASLTEFISEPISLEVDETKTHQSLLKTFQDQIDLINPRFESIPSCRITTYGRRDFHRGAIGKMNDKRLLIRVTESNILKPNNNERVFSLYK